MDPQLESDPDRVVVQLAGAVAHKLKQPLAVAWGYLELLLDDPSCHLEPIAVRYLQEIQASLESMKEVIDQLQQAATPQTGPYASSLHLLDLDSQAPSDGPPPPP